MAEQTLNIPQIVAVVLVGFLAIRWFFSSGSSGSAARGATRPINPSHLEQVHQMFPQLDRRSIMWDLQRNGGSVQATTERVLSGRALDQPPPSFQPQIPNSAAAPTASRPAAPKATQPDLITKYNLSSQIAAGEAGVGGAVDDAKGKSGWSQNKNERAELLKRRRDEMILRARQKMQEKGTKAPVVAS